MILILTPMHSSAPSQDQGDQLHHLHHHGGGRDWLFLISSSLVAVGYAAYIALGERIMEMPYVGIFAHTMFDILNTTWWSLLLGILSVGILGIIPRELIIGLFGRGGTTKGILRAVFAGVLLDVCSHGILMVGTKLYERGVSLGQTMAFLIASPWNSLSLTLILISLIGFPFTMAFLLLSMLIALISGLLFERFVRRGILPQNPHTPDLPHDFAVFPAFQQMLQEKKPSLVGTKEMLQRGLSESRLVLRWIFFGFVLTGFIRAFVPGDLFGQLFGPTLAGLFFTLIAATIIEVCSEGSTPVAADFITRAAAPGNAFTFLMAGVSTDYTEIMALRQATRSWKIALFLPLITLPQILLLGWLLNSAFGG